MDTTEPVKSTKASGHPEPVKSTKGSGGHLQDFETVLYLFNHILIGFTAIYITWYIFNGTLTISAIHAWLCIFGFQVLAAEGMMMFYPANPITTLLPPKWRKTCHWLLQVIGTVLGLAGAIYLYVNRTRTHFSSTHGLTGLIGTVLMLINLLGGIFTYYSRNLSNIIRPVKIKAIHNLIGICGLTLSLVSLYYGYNHFSRQLGTSFVLLLQLITIITIVLSAIGSLKSFSRQVSDVFSIN